MGLSLATASILLLFVTLVALCSVLFKRWKNEEALSAQRNKEAMYYRHRFLKLANACGLGDDYEDAEFDISEDDFLANHLKAKTLSN